MRDPRSTEKKAAKMIGEIIPSAPSPRGRRQLTGVAGSLAQPLDAREAREIIPIRTSTM